jgi:DNA-binding MarR family transcriptional regulator
MSSMISTSGFIGESEDLIAEPAGLGSGYEGNSAAGCEEEVEADDGVVVPPVPEHLVDTGLSPSVLEQLSLKMLYYRGDLSGRDLAQAAGLEYSVIEDTIETLKRQHLVSVKRSLGIGSKSAVYALSEAGRNLAREYLDNNQYAGPAPVPLYQYAAIVRRQKQTENWLTPETLAIAYRHMVVTPHILGQIGPAVNASKSFLIYGQPGNGKTALAEALFRLETEPIYIPYAIEYQGNIVQIFDPIYHQPIQDEETVFSAVSAAARYDHRWFKAKRPFIITGGELTMAMLDLSYNESSKVYDAPFQLKANNGFYLIDDFGRQLAAPAEILNRWIVPMERHIDYLSFRTGGKMTVPFEAFLIFSTNLHPDKLGDEAFLRRIQYKMFLGNPKETEYRTIFENFARSKELTFSPAVLNDFLVRHYHHTRKPMRRCHPRDVISHAIDLINFERLDWELTTDVLNHAWESCFAENPDMER